MDPTNDSASIQPIECGSGSESSNGTSATTSVDSSSAAQITNEELSKMNHWLHIAPSWEGYDALKYLFVFGASYCQVGYYGSRSPQPTAAEPLGVEFPGDTYNEPGEPNWVGYIARDFRPRDEAGIEKPLLVYDYAIGGQMVDGVRIQVERSFLPHAGQKPEWLPWTQSDSLFSIWIGVNDTAHGWQAKPAVENLFHVLNTLYGAGARTFLLIDVPPIHRSPARTSSLPKKFTDGLKSPKPYTTWNDELRSQGRQFSKGHSDASLFVFSAYDLFDAVLDDPVRFWFPPGDVKKRGGAIWFDHIHPSTKMHRIIAESLVTYLRSISGSSPGLEVGEDSDKGEANT